MQTKFINYDAILDSPIGGIGIILSDSSITSIDFLYRDVASPLYRSLYAERAAQELEAYFANPAHNFTLSCIPVGTPFQTQVWAELTAIPVGETNTYGEIASRLRSGARAVGNACRKNPIPILVACHRVVAANGIGGFSGEVSGDKIAVKNWLLQHESRLNERNNDSVKFHC